MSPRPAPKVHYLPGNKREWSPDVILYLDTETRTVIDGDKSIEVLALWCARLDVRLRNGRGVRTVGDSTGPDAASLAAWITAAVKGRTTIWGFCHNLAFDLVTTRLPVVLCGAGWTVTDAAVSGSAPWMRLAKGSTRLTLVDSHSWLPHPLEDIGRAVGLHKPALPVDADDDLGLAERCWADVNIMGTAMNRLLDWWDCNALGNWTISGAGCGWNAMRHIRPPVRPTINPDVDGIRSDRSAIHGGRRGAWQVGQRVNGPFLELDFRNAYPTIAATTHLPSRRMARFDSMQLDNWRLTDERWGVIANVHIRTEVPRWPVRVAGATFCPTGEFRADLAGPEITEALRLGALVSVGSGYVHQLQPHLAPWAEWVLQLANGQIEGAPEVAALAGKAWSRSVIGKWATRGYTREALGAAVTDGWGYEQTWDHETASRGALIDLGGQRWLTYAAGDAEQAYPAVLAWIESETRCRISRVIEAIGPRAVLQCDTDGLIVSERLLGTPAAKGTVIAPSDLTGPARTRWVLDQLRPLTHPLILRVKATHDTVKILGPQHVQTPTRRAYSGLPAVAQPRTEHNQLSCPDRQACTRGSHRVVVEDEFVYQSWPKLPWQLGHGDVRGYVRPTVSVTVRGPYAPGWVTTTGVVVPPETRLDTAGSTVLLSWSAMTRKPPRARLADHQHPVLAALW